MIRTDQPPRNVVKGATAIAAMRAAGRMLGQTLTTVTNALRPGVTGESLDRLAVETIRALGGEPGFIGFESFPSAICLSINDAIVHGLPAGQVVRAGDVVGIDCGVRLNGWNTDAAVTVVVPPIDPADRALVTATVDALRAGIAAVKPGRQLGDVQAVIQSVIDAGGYGLVRSLSGHGIGQRIHEPPSVPNYGTAGSGLVLEAGMTFCLEPMLTRGDGSVTTDADGWTVRSADGTRGAHQEHTVLVTEVGCDVLSAQPGEHFR
jgi:methionyl aminopeptidase